VSLVTWLRWLFICESCAIRAQANPVHDFFVTTCAFCSLHLLTPRNIAYLLLASASWLK